MDSQTPTTKQICPREEISLYLDGELSANDEILLEKHLTDCEACLAELNSQKQMLSALNFAFDKQAEIELPKDFTKIVVAKAESGVSGLRSKEERFRALFLCLALFLLLILGFGLENEKIFSTLTSFFNQVVAIAGFIVHFTYDISIGIAVILRSLSQKVIFTNGFIILSFGGVLLLFLLTVPRFVDKLSRPKTS